MSTTTPEQLAALGRRAVACKGWRWMAGMLYRGSAWSVSHPSVRVRDDDDHIAALKSGVAENAAAFEVDLSDPATLGCLLKLVREAYDSPAAHVMPHGNGPDFEGFICWDPMRFDHAGRLGEGDTETEALVAALEAGQ